MKKIIVGIFLISLLFSLTACSHKEEKEKKLVYLGINAEVLSVNYNDKILTVAGVGSEKKFLPAGVKLNCKALENDGKIFKTINSTKVELLKFDDLKVTDKIKINVSEKELNKEDTTILNIEQIELVEKN